MSHDKLAVLTISLLAAMILTAVIAVRVRLAAIVLILLAVAWFVVDQNFEGPVLWHVTYHHGLVTSDLVGVAAGLVGLALLVRPPH